MNAKEELLKLLKDYSVVLKCGYVGQCRYDIPDSKRKRAVLKVEFSEQEYTDFLNQIDYYYDSGFGSPEIDGELWFTNGTWANRSEYDGSEWWEYHKLPEIPEELAPTTDKEER